MSVNVLLRSMSRQGLASCTAKCLACNRSRQAKQRDLPSQLHIALARFFHFARKSFAQFAVDICDQNAVFKSAHLTVVIIRCSGLKG